MIEGISTKGRKKRTREDGGRRSAAAAVVATEGGTAAARCEVESVVRSRFVVGEFQRMAKMTGGATVFRGGGGGEVCWGLTIVHIFLIRSRATHPPPTDGGGGGCQNISYLCAGTNQCTRILEDAYRRRIERRTMRLPGSTEPPTATTTTAVVPSLILLARDVRPSSVLVHVHAYARLLNVPILILPGGRASAELGKAAGLRSASMAMFLPPPPSCDEVDDGREEGERERRGANSDVDSFVRYATSKIPK
jgi:hypothetical protein